MGFRRAASRLRCRPKRRLFGGSFEVSRFAGSNFYIARMSRGLPANGPPERNGGKLSSIFWLQKYARTSRDNICLHVTRSDSLNSDNRNYDVRGHVRFSSYYFVANYAIDRHRIVKSRKYV